MSKPILTKTLIKLKERDESKINMNAFFLLSSKTAKRIELKKQQVNRVYYHECFSGASTEFSGIIRFRHNYSFNFIIKSNIF